MAKLVIGQPIPTGSIRDSYVLRLVFSAKDHRDHDDMWFFKKGEESQLLEAVALLKEYFTVPYNERCSNPMLFGALDKPDIVDRIESQEDYAHMSSLDTFLEDLLHAWPQNSHYDSMMLDTFYITFYDDNGTQFEVKVED